MRTWGSGNRRNILTNKYLINFYLVLNPLAFCSKGAWVLKNVSLRNNPGLALSSPAPPDLIAVSAVLNESSQLGLAVSTTDFWPSIPSKIWAVLEDKTSLSAGVRHFNLLAASLKQSGPAAELLLWFLKL